MLTETCLYTGEENVSETIEYELTLLETGKWNQTLIGLESETINHLLKKQKRIKYLTAFLLNLLKHDKYHMSCKIKQRILYRGQTCLFY